MARRSKAVASFADAFSRSLGLGANIAMQQKRLGEEYAWRQQQETARQQELADRIGRQDRIRSEDISREKARHAETVAYRKERDTKADTRYQEGLRLREEDRKEASKQRYLDRQSREKIAGMQKTGSRFDLGKRITLKTAEAEIRRIAGPDSVVPEELVFPLLQAITEKRSSGKVSPESAGKLYGIWKNMTGRETDIKGIDENELRERFAYEYIDQYGLR